MEPSDRVRNVGHLMKVDAVTASVVSRLREVGIRSILLKGPSFGRWLYDHASDRLYSDTDLLVPSRDAAAVGEVLTEMSFEVAIPRDDLDRPVPAVNWLRRRGGSSVDVHVGLTGCEVPYEEQWEVLSEANERLKVGGAEVEVLGPAGRTLHVVLHASQHGRDPRPLRDLEKAVERVPEATWGEAAALAERLNALPAFSGGLRLLPEGAALAERLGLPEARSVEVLLREEQPPLALGLKWLTEMPGIRPRLRLVGSKLFPPADKLVPPGKPRSWPVLAAAYLRNAWRMTRLAGPAWLALRRARRRARTEASGSRPSEMDKSSQD